MKQFSGGDEYWDALVPLAAQTHAEAVLDKTNHAVSVETGGNGARSGCSDRPAWPSGIDCEPVHGWTRRQFDAYMIRNPRYLAAYDAELSKHVGWPFLVAKQLP